MAQPRRYRTQMIEITLTEEEVGEGRKVKAKIKVATMALHEMKGAYVKVVPSSQNSPPLLAHLETIVSLSTIFESIFENGRERI